MNLRKLCTPFIEQSYPSGWPQLDIQLLRPLENQIWNRLHNQFSPLADQLDQKLTEVRQYRIDRKTHR